MADSPTKDSPIKDDEFWRDKLSPEEFQICRNKGTERAFTGEYYNNKAAGEYLCKCCGEQLFKSGSKYDSGSGWPSFYEPAQNDLVAEHRDTTHGMIRTEITCANCGSHLGHVFPDGPQPTGLRYCVNSASLDFKPAED